MSTWQRRRNGSSERYNPGAIVTPESLAALIAAQVAQEVKALFSTTAETFLQLPATLESDFKARLDKLLPLLLQKVEAKAELGIRRVIVDAEANISRAAKAMEESAAYIKTVHSYAIRHMDEAVERFEKRVDAARESGVAALTSIIGEEISRHRLREMVGEMVRDAVRDAVREALGQA